MKNIFELFTEKDKVRFWSHVDIREPDQCWPWQLSATQYGYGIFSVRSKLYRTHRFIKIIEGVDLKDNRVTTTCHNPLCCNPKHLEVLSQRDIMDRMKARGKACVGSKNKASKLTEANIVDIRNRYQKQSATDGFKGIGADYGVTPGCIRDIVIRKTWYHVE